VEQEIIRTTFKIMAKKNFNIVLLYKSVGAGQFKEFADFFHVTEDYFYEYRLKRMLEFLDKNREFLDHCEKESRKYKKGLSPTESEHEEQTA
jgi:hypothetical protein